LIKTLLPYLFFVWIFIGAISAHLAGPYSIVDGSDVFLLGNPMIYGVLKGGIVILLLLATGLSFRETRVGFKIFMMIALVFSLLGDLLLMFPESYFAPGLGCFLIAHVFYMVTFVKGSSSLLQLPLIKKLPLLPILLGAAALLILWSFRGKLGDLALPVIIYVLVIAGMSIMAMNRYQRTSLKSFTWVFLGSLVFMLSDFLIASNKFDHPIHFAPFLIMITYAMAQGLIVFGMLKHDGK